MWRVFCLTCITICFIIIRPFVVIFRKLRNKRNEVYNKSFDYFLTGTKRGAQLNDEYKQSLHAARMLGDNIVIEDRVNSGALVDIMRMEHDQDFAGITIDSILISRRKSYTFEELAFMWLSLVLRLRSDSVNYESSSTEWMVFRDKFSAVLLNAKLTPWSAYLRCGDSKIRVYSILEPSTIFNLIIWVKLVGLVAMDKSSDEKICTALSNMLIKISEPLIGLPQVLKPSGIVASIEQWMRLYILAYTGYLMNPSFYFANVWEEIGKQLVPYSNLVIILMARVEKFDVPDKLNLLPYGALDTTMEDLKNRLSAYLNMRISETGDLFQDLQEPCLKFIHHTYTKVMGKHMTKPTLTSDEQLTLLLSTFVTLDKRLRLNHV